MISRILTARKRPKEAESFSTPRQKEAAAPNVRDARLLRPASGLAEFGRPRSRVLATRSVQQSVKARRSRPLLTLRRFRLRALTSDAKAEQLDVAVTGFGPA